MLVKYIGCCSVTVVGPCCARWSAGDMRLDTVVPLCSTRAVLARLKAALPEEWCELPHMLFAEALDAAVQGTREVAATGVDEFDQVDLQHFPALLNEPL